jgi:PAS domain S-box-containing protein
LPNIALQGLHLDDSPEAVIATAGDGTVLFWNCEAEALFGYRADEAIGRCIEELIVPPGLVEEDRQVRARALDSGVAVYESVRRRKDGSPVNVAISSRARRDPASGVAYVLSSKSDITHLRVLRDAKLVEARFSELLESMPDGIVVVNLTGHLVYANRQAEAMFGYARGEIRGRPVEVLLPARYRAPHVGHRSGYFTQPRTRAMGAGLALYGLRKDGTEFPVEISLSPLKAEEDLLAVSAIRDTSERKRIERALQEKNVELERANLAKDRFLATMSHELRTPLNAVIGFTGTLLMRLPGPLNAEQEKQLRTVRSSAGHLLSLINDLLDLAKIEAGKVELVLEPTACRAVMEDVGASLRPLAEEKGLALDVELPGEGFTVLTDRRALSQILLNLANNAIKFTASGRVALRVVAQAGEQGQVTQFIVEDTGIGLSSEDQARLFEAFSRFGAAATRTEGTGLGLHLSRKLAELLGGRLTFSSVVGSGSTFVLELREQ